MSVEEDDGTKADYYFSDNGRGYTGVRDAVSIIKESFKRLRTARSMSAIGWTVEIM